MLGMSQGSIIDHGAHGDSGAVILRRIERRCLALRKEIDGRLREGTRGAPRLPALVCQERFGLGPQEGHVLSLLLSLERSLPCLLALREGDRDPVFFPSLGMVDELLAEHEGAPLSAVQSLLSSDRVGLRSLIQVMDGAGMRGAPLCRLSVRLRPRVRDFLLGLSAIAESLRTLLSAAPSSGHEIVTQDLRIYERLRPAPPPMGNTLWLIGPPGAGRRTLAGQICARWGRPLWIISWDDLAAEAGQMEERLSDLELESRLTGPVLMLDFRGPFEPQRERALRVLRRVSSEVPSPLILGTDDATTGVPTAMRSVMPYRLKVPDEPDRKRILEQVLSERGGALSEQDLDELARDFRLHVGPLRAVVSMCDGDLDGAGLCGQIRQQGFARIHAELAELAEPVRTSFGFADLVVSEETLDGLHEITRALAYRDVVMGEWGMGDKMPYGRGVHAIFSGPPGTGKTMAASVIANELGRELFRVEISRLVSKYIGETEKNLGRIFDAAAGTQAVLFFDEADALFSRRTSVQSSVDRYANLETGYLLQRMEQHEGMTILATNLPGSMDEAFVRRIPYRVAFEMPDAGMRGGIWAAYLRWPLPVGDDVDFQALGERFDLSAAHIKNAVVRAALHAAEAGGLMDMDRLCHAAVQEMQNLGRVVTSAARR